MSDTVPTGDTIEVVLDRMQRASNFASNGVLMATEYVGERDPLAVARTYINAAQAMLDEARHTLDVVVAQ